MSNSLSNVLAKLNAFQEAFYVDPSHLEFFSQGPLVTIKTLNRKDLSQGGLTSGLSKQMVLFGAAYSLGLIKLVQAFNSVRWRMVVLSFYMGLGNQMVQAIPFGGASDGLSFEVRQLFSFCSAQLIWIKFLSGPSPAISDFIVKCFFTRFSTGLFV